MSFERSLLKKCKFLLMTGALCTLASCTTVQQPSSLSSPSVFTQPKAKDAWLSSLQTWQAEGSFGARKAGDAWSGSFEWKQLSKNTYEIHFYGPFGAGNTYLYGNAHQVILKDNDGEIRASTPEELIAEKTGFLFPVSYLYNWILGRPAPGVVTHKQFNSQGHLIYFTQAGWKVTYLAYQPIGLGELPTAIRLNHDNIQLKLIIRKWKLG
jgi:outer membrane lipoprotein LolB